MASTEDQMIVGLRPHQPEPQAPIRQPSGDPSEINMFKPSDLPSVSPCWTKKAGIDVTNPKISVLTTISTILPTIMRGSSAGDTRDARLDDGTTAGGRAGTGNGTPPDASLSIC